MVKMAHHCPKCKEPAPILFRFCPECDFDMIECVNKPETCKHSRSEMFGDIMESK
jgi:hypothetical protein